MRTVAIPARFGPAELRGWIGTWSAARGAPELRLELPAGAHLEASGIVLLAAGIAHRRTLGLRTWMSSMPGGGAALAALADADFFRELGVESLDPDAARRVPSAGFRVPLRRITDLSVARRQADATRELLEAIVPTVPPSTVRAAQFVFEELAANIVQHSRATETGFGLAVADPATRRIQIAFGDAGVGFFSSLTSNPEFAGRVADDAEAIRLALDRRVSRRAGGNIGMGLFVLSSFAERVRGDLSIATGTSMLVRRAGGGSPGAESIESTAGWGGAFLALDAPVPGW